MPERNIRKLVEEYSRRNPGVRNIAAFLTAWPQIKELLDEGWKVKPIWQTLRDAGELTITYNAFARHVRKRRGKTTSLTPEENRMNAKSPALALARESSKPVWGKPVERTQEPPSIPEALFGKAPEPNNWGKF